MDNCTSHIEDYIDFGSKKIGFSLVDTSMEKVKEKLRKKAPWIIRQQSFFLSFHPKTGDSGSC